MGADKLLLIYPPQRYFLKDLKSIIGKRVFGYVQQTNTSHNAVINGESIHAFHVELTDENYNKLEYLW